MDKEKEIEIERMARMLGSRTCYSCRTLSNCKDCRVVKELCQYREDAIALQKAGYGNVKQAVKEFAEKVKEFANEMACDECEYWSFERKLNDLIKEIYGEGGDES